MYLLKKVFELREKAHPDHEKPFLEHLEDLRVMITRVVITLVISMIVCFAFQKQLMNILRAPAEKVLLVKQQETMPSESKFENIVVPTVEDWNEAKDLEQTAAALDEVQRAKFFKALGEPDMEFHARSVSLLRATMALPEETREDFIKNLEMGEKMTNQLLALLDSGPDVTPNSGSNIRMMSALKPTETFMLSMKLAFFAGIVLAFPLLLMFLLQFVLPGLHEEEKKVLWPAMLIGFGLFLVGVLFSYFFVLPRALLFFYEWSGDLGVSNDWRIGEYITFATQFTLLFGLSFELPVVVMVLVKLGLLSYETMSKTRTYAIVAIYVAAAVITPTPDIMTLNLMALPMLLLYEICIWLAWFDRKKAREEEAREEEELKKRRQEWLITNEARSQDDEHHDYPVEPHSGLHEDFVEHGDDGWHDDYHHDHHDMEAAEDWAHPDDAITGDALDEMSEEEHIRMMDDETKPKPKNDEDGK
ncbi:twin-arginine translocase subunit TatC [Luteolibacter algae]|uniref:Sec-independent protein translocase protein TatC n=1 Tax=Luteolibacter algae TaxID=454151 RepID=A0ABW5D872_9BACT